MRGESKLDSLTEFLAASMPPGAMQSFASSIKSIKTIASARDMGLGQMQLSVIRYDTTLMWQRFPYRDCDPRLLIALLEVWQVDASPLPLCEMAIADATPVLDIDVTDDNSATVLLTVPMAEALVIVPDDAGPIPWAGKQYRLAGAEIWTALTAQIRMPDGSQTTVSS